jgi:hypothetical protein
VNCGRELYYRQVLVRAGGIVEGRYDNKPLDGSEDYRYDVTCDHCGTENDLRVDLVVMGDKPLFTEEEYAAFEHRIRAACMAHVEAQLELQRLREAANAPLQEVRGQGLAVLPDFIVNSLLGHYQHEAHMAVQEGRSL